MIKFEYDRLNKDTTNLKNTTHQKKKKFRTPEAWAKGLILLNWKYMNLLWEQRIASAQEITSDTSETINEQYFLVQKVLNLQTEITSLHPQDRQWMSKSREEISKLSLNQLKLWINNYNNLRNLKKNEDIMRNEV